VAVGLLCKLEGLTALEPSVVAVADDAGYRHNSSADRGDDRDGVHGRDRNAPPPALVAAGTSRGFDSRRLHRRSKSASALAEA
jgi:hypothetical protein